VTTWELLRLFLHITAATIWVGGQLVLAALVPSVRAEPAPRMRHGLAVTRSSDTAVVTIDRSRL